MNLVLAMTRLLKHRVVHDGPTSARSPSVTGSAPALARSRNASVRAAGSDDQRREPGASARRLSEWLRPQQILLDVDVADRHRALEIAADLIGRAQALDSAPIFRALWRREEVGSTALGQGVAIPHARMAGIARPLTLFMRTRYAMAFDVPDGKPVSNILVIMVPADGDPDDHLQFLALVAQTFSDRDFRACLSASTTALEVDKAFAEWAEKSVT